MIHSLTFSNLASFYEEATIDFTWDKKDSIDSTTHLMPSGTRVSKVMAVIGANASGKSNMIRIIHFLKYWIVEAWQTPPEGRISRGIIPFMLSNEKKEEISIDCVFETKKGQYRIELVLKGGYAFSEKISTRTPSLQRKTWKTIFNRDNIPESDLPFVRKNASILFTKQRAIDPVSDDIVSYWSNVNTKVSHAAKIEELDFPAAKNELIKTYHENPEKLAFVNDLLQKFDTGLTGINIIESEDINPNGSRDIKAKAMVKTTEGEFEMPYLSEGTMKIIDNAHVIYHVLSTGSVLVFDELDASFHPEVVDAILDLFFSDKSNPLNAQLIFTTLNPRILRKLHRYQIQLVEKDSNGVSHTYRLDDIEGVRVDDNYYAKYMAGAYGALPNIDI